MKVKENKNYVNFQEIIYYFYCSWVSAFKLLGQNLVKEKEDLKKIGVDAPGVNQLVTWAKNFQDNIRMYLESSFRECGIDFNQDISFDQYKYWTSKNPQNIQVFYANKYLTCATNLNSLEDIEYIESSI